jgi:hypothetical protein
MKQPNLAAGLAICLPPFSICMPFECSHWCRQRVARHQPQNVEQPHLSIVGHHRTSFAENMQLAASVFAESQRSGRGMSQDCYDLKAVGENEDDGL